MQQYVGYYRVSTDRQGKSGLGIDAQHRAVESYVNGKGELVATFTEIESGKRNDRPALQDALALCKKRKARLIIAKLDRLSRNSAFINNLLESGVDFIAADMPEATPFILRIMAAVAQQERDMISVRTKDALEEAKAQGTRLGNPRPEQSLQQGRETAARNRATHHALVKDTITTLRAQSMTLRAIADELNARGIPTVTGRRWEAQQVRNVLNGVFCLTPRNGAFGSYPSV